MDLPKCPRCGEPAGSENFYIHSLTLKCPKCDYSGPPGASGAGILAKMKIDKGKPYDPFSSELSLQAISSKLAIAGLSLAIVFAWFPGLMQFAVVSFSAFLLFSSMFGFLRLRER